MCGAWGIVRVKDEILIDDVAAFEETARAAAVRFEHRVKDRAWTFDDVWEWDLTTWDWHFLWACHAIVWGIAQYDQHKATDRG